MNIQKFRVFEESFFGDLKEIGALHFECKDVKAGDMLQLHLGGESVTVEVGKIRELAVLVKPGKLSQLLKYRQFKPKNTIKPCVNGFPKIEIPQNGITYDGYFKAWARNLSKWAEDVNEWVETVNKEMSR